MGELIGIGALARAAGVSAGTVRHYASLGLLMPTLVTRAGYRRYSAGDEKRLRMIRLLRSLDFDLAAIGELLDPRTDLRRSAERRLAELTAELNGIVAKRIVLKTLLDRKGDHPSLEHLAVLNAVTEMAQPDRERFFRENLRERAKLLPPSQARDALLSVVRSRFPGPLSPERLEAWLELSLIVSDAGFLRRHVEAPRETELVDHQASLPASFFQLVAAAAVHARSGRAPYSAAGRSLVKKAVAAVGRHDGDGGITVARVLAMIETTMAQNEYRFWLLLETLDTRLAQSDSAMGFKWLIEAFRAFAVR